MLPMLRYNVRGMVGVLGHMGACRSASSDSTFHPHKDDKPDHEFRSERPNEQVGMRLEKCLNEVTLLGRVGSDPQQRGTELHPVTLFTIATHTNYKYGSDEFKQKTEWHRVSVFKPFLRDSVYKYLSKGQRAMVRGKLTYGQITDSAGATHTTTSIVADEVIFFNKAQPKDVDF